MNHKTLCQEVLRDTKSCFLYLQNQNLVPDTPICDDCGKTMKLVVRGDHSVIFMCQKTRVQGEKPHDRRVNALAGSVFEGARFGLTNIVSLMYFFSKNITNPQFLEEECLGPSSTASASAILEWLSFCRQVCCFWMNEIYENEQPLLGGEGMVVEVDTLKIGNKIKDSDESKGKWVLGMMEVKNEAKGRERRGSRFRLEPFPGGEVNKDSVIPFIQKNIEPGTCIMTDDWFGYTGLEEFGYKHVTVTKCKNLNVSTIESSWRKVKGSLSDIPSENLVEHLGEYLYRREVAASGVDRWEYFLNALHLMNSS